MKGMQSLASTDSLLEVLSKSEMAMAIYETDEIIIRFVNDAMTAFWGKDRSIVGLPLEDAVPELRGQPFKKMLQNVLATGIVDEGVIPATTLVDGVLQTHYYEYQYKPIVDSEGTAYCILHTAKDVTQLRNAEIEKQRLTDNLSQLNEEMAATNEELRSSNEELGTAQIQLQTTFHQLEESEIALRLAIEAANFGTWHIHSVTRNFITSTRLRQLLGYLPDEEITIEDALSRITEDYRGYVSTTLENAIYHGGDYDVTYPAIGFHDQKLRWLRAIGNLSADPSGEFSAFTGVVMDVSDLKKEEQRKNDFIGMVSHELKTPLTSLKAYLQILQLKAKKAGSTTEEGALDRSLKQVNRMTTMINGFLNISRLESGRMHIDKQRFDMRDLILDLEDETRALYPSYEIVFDAPEPAYIIGDQDKVGQVITNFISNAAKYSKTGTEIRISCQALNGSARLSVSDQGVGIRQEEISRLFERYYRVEDNSNIAGFGIGLYLCSEIIERHDGTIWAESELGQGSVFYFSIPLAN